MSAATTTLKEVKINAIEMLKMSFVKFESNAPKVKVVENSTNTVMERMHIWIV
jgi:hypothetical protein